MHVFMFAPRFHHRILDHTKRQTIRVARKREPVPGDLLSLRAWDGKPYRSKQVELREVVCTRVETVSLERWNTGRGTCPIVKIDGVVLAGPGSDAFARDDGFHDFSDFLRFWETERAFEFEGRIYSWR